MNSSSECLFWLLRSVLCFDNDRNKNINLNFGFGYYIMLFAVCKTGTGIEALCFGFGCYVV